MTRTRNMSDLLDSNGDVKASALDNTSSDLVDDSTPQLGGDLDLNGSDITGTGNLDINGTTTTNRLIVDDDGSGSPLLEVNADDGSPWALKIGNDTFSTGDHGILSFVASDGTARIQSQGKDGSFEDLNFAQHSGTSGSTRNLIQMASNGEARLFYQGNQKLATKTGGVDITGDLAVSGSITAPTLFNVVRKDNTLVSNITTSTDGYVYGNYSISSHTSSNTKAVIIAIQFQYNGSSNTHGYMNGYVIQQGKTANTEKGQFIKEHFDWYYNRYDTELIIPWDASGTQSVQLYISSSHNTNSNNKYSVILRGVINQ